LRAADENPFFDVSSHPQAFAIGRYPSRPVRVGSTGACFIFCFRSETRVRPLRGAASHEVSCSLQRLQVALRCRARRPASDSPTSTFDRPFFSLHHVTRVGHRRRFRGSADRAHGCRGSISSLWFWNSRIAPCVFGRVRHAPLGPSRFTPVRPGHASRSLFGATFRYPCFVEPFHNRAAHSHFVCRASCAATLMGFSHPSQCSPSAGPGVCDATLAFLCARLHLRRSSPPAVIEFTSRRLFLQLSVARVSESVKQTPSTYERIRRKRATDCDAIQPAPGCCCRRRAEPGHVFNRARPILPWALASPFGLIGCFFTARRRRMSGARTTACRSFFLNAAIRSWVLRATARKDVLEDRLHPTRARSDLIYLARRTFGFSPLAVEVRLFKDRSRQEHPCRRRPLERI